ncbi:MAG: M67 family metallopeptidase [Gammaproteobacteria bacterium]|uniref:M67 family metallopeptidase n=1 Tax=Candidatus Thiopontia autotrophica TaxID=2841688 RepID=A0A8J6P155_9GAMM|nr:M67 family metallopeptidase [Candidatus Thiopontia autotrophica]MBL6968625.1 M67 family metallopeptidase [Gammaproteobacteria bacterium]
MSAQIPRPLAVQLLAEAQNSPEQEVCGLIGGVAVIASKIYPITNVSPDPESRFEMDPIGQITAMRDIRERGTSLWAIYHSHPHSPAKPSRKDLMDAAYPDSLYLVISLNTEGVLEMRGYRMESGDFSEVSLEIV